MWNTAAWIVAAILFLGLTACIYLLNRRNQADNSRWKRIADQKYKEGRNEASQILRAAVDQITDDKSRMSAMSDRELITEAVLALSALGRRMDRMEDALHLLPQFESLLTSINDQAGVLSENAEILARQVTDAQNAAAAFQSAVAGTGEAVYSLSDSTHSVENLLEDVSGQISTLTGFSASFSALQDQMKEALNRMNRTLKVTADNPAAALSQMDGRIASVYSQLENLSQGLNLMAESLEGIQDTLNSLPASASGEPEYRPSDMAE